MRIEGEFKELKEKYGFQDDKLENILKLNNANDRRAALQDHLKPIAKSWWFQTPEGAARKIENKLAMWESTKTMSSIYTEMKTIGDELAGFINLNPEFVAAMQNEFVYGTKVEFQMFESAVTKEKVEEKRKLMTEKGILDKWKNRKRSLTKEMCGEKKTWEGRGEKGIADDDDEQNKVRDAFLKEIEEELGEEKGKGFYSSVVSGLYRTGGREALTKIKDNKEDKLK